MIIGAHKVSDFQPLKKEEVDALINQLNEGFGQGIPPQETVSFPAFVLAQLLATVKFLSENQGKSKIKSMDDLLHGLTEDNPTDTETTGSPQENG